VNERSPNEAMVIRSVYLSPEVDAQLKRLSYMLNVPKGNVIRLFVNDGLQKVIDTLDETPDSRQKWKEKFDAAIVSDETRRQDAIQLAHVAGVLAKLEIAGEVSKPAVMPNGKRAMKPIETNKWVRVMADYSAAPFWNINGTCMGMHALPISSTLKAEFQDWTNWYETNQDYLDLEDRTVEFDTQGFADKGKELAKKLKEELSDWTVIYFDESKVDRTIGSNQTREEFEYEIS
jgi:hypothetical protein